MFYLIYTTVYHINIINVLLRTVLFRYTFYTLHCMKKYYVNFMRFTIEIEKKNSSLQGRII